MDIGTEDFFISKYIMGQLDIIELLDEDVIDNVKKMRFIIAVEDPIERKHREASVLWYRLSNDIKDHITLLFNTWIGNHSEEEKTARVKKYYIVKKINDTQRKISYPIHNSIIHDNLMEYATGKKDKYKLAFSNADKGGVFKMLWTGLKKCTYGDRSEMSFAEARKNFSKVIHGNRRILIHTFLMVLFAIHNILKDAGIYSDYPLFIDYKNMLAHIVLKGREYCLSIIEDPQLVRPLLEYEEFHPIWNNFLENYISN
jgi:hypothetical protein